MDDAQLIEWLMENGGPIVRWRTATELPGGTASSELSALARDLSATPVVQETLGRLTLGDLADRLDHLDAAALGRLGNMVHGSKVTCLENVLGRLAEYGLRAGMPQLDERALHLMRLFRWRPDRESDVIYGNAWETLTKSVFAWGLLRLGYPPDGPMSEFLLSHLHICHKIARDRVFDIYADQAELVGLPKAWVGKPVIKQEVMANYWLPYIHDLYVFAHWPAAHADEALSRMLEDLLAYILDPRFQALHEGYGYAWIKERRTCYGWGWSPHLPGYKGFAALADATATPLVARVELMAHFPLARRSPWFQDALGHLETFRTPQGTYLLPRPLPSRGGRVLCLGLWDGVGGKQAQATGDGDRVYIQDAQNQEGHMTSKIAINRAPVLTLWAAVVAERLGYDPGTALTLGQVLGKKPISNKSQIASFSHHFACGISAPHNP